MSNVPASERTESKLKVFIEARNLAVYTIQICNNEKVFLPKYKSALTDDIVQTAKDVFIFAYKANDIRVVGDLAKDKYRERAHFQRQALLACDSLFPLIEIAMKVYHLKASRVEYWTGLTMSCKNLLQAWMEKDAERYKSVV